MRILILLSIAIFLTSFSSCSSQKREKEPKVNWSERVIDVPQDSLLITGVTYLPVYSNIYSQTEHLTHELTVTVSIRNTNSTDSLYLYKADYFDTHGKLIHAYTQQSIFIGPMETLEIVINESDKAGGSGGNFLFEWVMSPDSSEPLIEAVMISTSGQQGLSFSSRGVRID